MVLWFNNEYKVIQSSYCETLCHVDVMW